MCFVRQKKVTHQLVVVEEGAEVEGYHQVALLRQEGTLRVERGKGTFVAAAPIRYAIGKRVRYNESLKAQGHTIRYELVRSLEVPADDALAEMLNVELNAGVALIERVSFVDEQPLSVSSSYFPLTLFSDLLMPESLQQFQAIYTFKLSCKAPQNDVCCR